WRKTAKSRSVTAESFVSVDLARGGRTRVLLSSLPGFINCVVTLAKTVTLTFDETHLVYFRIVRWEYEARENCVYSMQLFSCYCNQPDASKIALLEPLRCAACVFYGFCFQQSLLASCKSDFKRYLPWTLAASGLLSCSVLLNLD
ncbi:unnamed protein product, partial [Phaeothamnion confervicola]